MISNYPRRIRYQWFEKAFGIEKPLFIDNLKFDVKQRQLDIYLNFEAGSKFKYVSEEEHI